jgi:hypothetical protein
MTFYISLKKYLPDNPLKLLMLVGNLLYNSDKKLVGAYAWTGPNKMVYTTNGNIYAPEDVSFCFDINDEKQIKVLDDWAKENGYKMKIDII